MGASLTTILDLANENLKFDDLVNLPTTERQEAVRKAIREYSRMRPYSLLQAYTASSDNWYELPTLWDDEFSEIIEIESPVEETPPSKIPASDYDIELMTDGNKIRFFANAPPSGDVFWVRFKGLHTIDSDLATTVPSADDKGVSYLATSLMCQILATFFASKADSNLSEVDIVGYTTRSEEYMKAARNWKKLFISTIKPDITGVHGHVPFIEDAYWDRTNE